MGVLLTFHVKLFLNTFILLEIQVYLLLDMLMKNLRINWGLVLIIEDKLFQKLFHVKSNF